MVIDEADEEALAFTCGDGEGATDVGMHTLKQCSGLRCRPQPDWLASLLALLADKAGTEWGVCSFDVKGLEGGMKSLLPGKAEIVSEVGVEVFTAVMLDVGQVHEHIKLAGIHLQLELGVECLKHPPQVCLMLLDNGLEVLSEAQVNEASGLHLALVEVNASQCELRGGLSL